MATPDVLTVADFRANLAGYLQSVSADPRARVYVGARRKPEAVVMALAADVPPHIRQRLLSAFMARAGTHVLQDSKDSGGAVVDTAAGDVFAWLWRTDPDRVPLQMGELMAQIHHHQPEADPTITFDDVLAAFRVAMPPDFTDGEFAEFAAACRKHVHAHYSEVNCPPPRV
ncbi:MAG: hypothetical protein H6523_13235 [Mycolicibacterium sp.]|nr:hypothetical protein [Mycolicibacterium sp.]